MGNRNRRPALHEPPQRLLNLALRLRIDGGGYLVRIRVPVKRHRASNHDALLLPARQAVAALPDPSLLPSGKRQ